MIRIVDYGVGNIQAFLNVYKGLGVQASRARNSEELSDATRLILPGVGSFDHAMTLLERSGMKDTLNHLVFEESIPVLGICVGMQMLSDGSDEGLLPGLGWIPGKVKHFSAMSDFQNLPMPHMGWNTLDFEGSDPLFTGFRLRPRFYFLHSYYFEPASNHSIVAKACYSSPFAAIVRNRNIYGVQCHPEKSHAHGTLLLKNFAEV